MKPIGRKYILGYGIAVIVIIFAFVPVSRRSTAFARGAMQTQELSLSDALARVSRQTGARIVVELPDRPAVVTLNGTSRMDALKEITGQMELQRNDAAGITVLRPKSYRAVNEAEATYRASMQNLISFLKGLSAAQRQALAAGNWLDAAQLSPEKQEQVRLALYEDAPSAKDWEAYKMQGKIVVTFLFDPYVEPVEGDGFGVQTFFLAPRNFPDFASLRPGKVPGIVVSDKVSENN